MDLFKLFLIILTQQKPDRQKGFAVVYALAFGLVITSIVMAMIFRAIQQSETVNLNRNQQKSQRIAETAMTRSQDFFDNNRLLLLFSSQLLREIADGETTESQTIQQALRGCKNDSDWQKQLDQINIFSSGQWFSTSGGRWKLTQYEYDIETQTGTLIVDGETDSNLPTRLKSTIKLELPSVPVIHLLGRDTDGTDRLIIDGNVWVKNCQVNLSHFRLANIHKNSAFYTGVPTPKLPSLLFSDIIKIPEQQKNIVINNPSTDIVFPRPGDVPSNNYTDPTTGEEVLIYSYIIDSINITNASRKIIVQTKANGKTNKVIFYLLKSARGTIENQCGNPSNVPCKANDFFIFGYGGDKEITLGNLDEANPQICLRINNALDGVIFAPGYQVGVNRNMGPTEYRGLVVADIWDTSGACGSNGISIRLKSSLQWSDFPQELQYTIKPPRIAGTKSWQPLPVSDPENYNEVPNYDQLPAYVYQLQLKQPSSYVLLPENAASIQNRFRGARKEEESPNEQTNNN